MKVSERTGCSEGSSIFATRANHSSAAGSSLMWQWNDSDVSLHLYGWPCLTKNYEQSSIPLMSSLMN
jgi:hypothetical protein